MSKDTKKIVRLPFYMSEYIKSLADNLQISENDVLKMIIHEYMRKKD